MTEQEAFEYTMKTQRRWSDLRFSDGHYINASVQHAWIAWRDRGEYERQRVQKLIDAAQAALDGGVFKHPSIREQLKNAISECEEL